MVSVCDGVSGYPANSPEELDFHYLFQDRSRKLPLVSPIKNFLKTCYRDLFLHYRMALSTPSQKMIRARMALFAPSSASAMR